MIHRELIPSIVLILAGTGLMFILWPKAETTQYDFLSTLTNQLEIQIRQHEESLVKVSSGWDNNYDQTLKNTLALKTMSSQMSKTIARFDTAESSIRIRKAHKDLKQSLEQSLSSSETLLTDHSLLASSLHFFPLLVASLEGKDRLEAEHLSKRLNEFIQLPSPSTLKDFAKAITRIEIRVKKTPEKQKVSLLEKHADIILDESLEVRTSLHSILNNSPSQNIPLLREELFQANQKITVRNRNINFLLGALALLFLVYIIFAIRQLNQKNLAISLANKKLQDQKFAMDQHAIVSVTSPSGDFMYVNDKFCSISGYSRDELIGENHRILNSGKHHDTYFDELKQSAHSGKVWHGEICCRSKDGIHYWISSSVVPFHNLAGEHVQNVSIHTDITSRKEAELAMLASEERYRTLVERAPYAILVHQNGRWKFINRAAIHLFEAKCMDDIVGQPIKQFSASGRPTIFSNGNNSKTATCPLVNVELRRIDQTIFEAEVTTMEISWQQGVATLVMIADMTERLTIEREKQKLREKSDHSQRLESLGVLAGGIAHDFNNILTAIMGNASLASNMLDEKSRAKDHLRRIESSSKRAADLCKQMLAYSGKGKFIIEAINLTDLMSDISSIIHASIGKHIDIQHQLSEDIPTVDADPAQMQQIAMNLIINASEAIGSHNHQGQIVLKTGTTQIKDTLPNHVLLSENITPGTYAYLEVSDNGCGMDAKTRAKIFDPFFTTKFTGRGLGMSAVLGIVRGHKGALSIESSPGKGSCFRVLLPLGKMAMPTRKAAPGKSNMWRGSGTILVVDDEQSILDIATMMLEDMGFKVLTAIDGQQGVKIFSAHQDQISTVLLDMTMPNMDGEQTCREIQKIQPDTKIILSSGYSEQEATQNFSGKLAAFIQKPYQPETLRETIRTVNKTA